MAEVQLLEILKSQVLTEKQAELAKHNLTRYIPYLKSKYMISIDDQEEIESLNTTRKKSGKIIDILLSRGAKAYDCLCEAILDLGVETDLIIKLNLLLDQKMKQHTGAETVALSATNDTSDLPTPSSVSRKNTSQLPSTISSLDNTNTSSNTSDSPSNCTYNSAIPSTVSTENTRPASSTFV